MAHIRKLPSGSWNAVVRHPSGRKISKTDPLKRVVVAWAQDLEAAIRNGDTTVGPSRLTVQQWHDTWQRTRAVEATTAQTESMILRSRILPRWKDWPLRAIARSDVQAWINDMAGEGLAGSYIRTVYRKFVKLLSDAVEDGKLSVSPCRKIVLPRDSRPTPRWLTRGEYDRIQLALDGDVLSQAIVAVGCFCGLRPGEIGGLDVERIDFDRQLIHVEQVMTPKGLRSYPKTDASRRWVPFPAEVGELLWRVVADKGEDEPAFTMTRGARLRHSNWAERVWGPALKRAGVKHVRPYVMRHTAASWLVQSGRVSTEDIAAVLGHGGTRLVSLYAHLDPKAHDRVRAAWAQAGGPPVAHAPRVGSPIREETAGQ